jgi:hypothetical protein
MEKVMKKKILFYAPFAIFPFHFETELELAAKYLRDGHSVTFLSCDGDLPTCDPNPDHKYSTCTICKSRRIAGMKWLGGNNVRFSNFYEVTEEQKQIVQEFKSMEISSLEELKEISIDGSDIGMATFGSIICIIREPYPDLQKYLHLIRKNLMASAIVHFSLKNHLTRERPDEVIIFNGRMAPLRPALRLTQSLGIETYVHERSGDLNRYTLSRNTYPHALDFMKQEIELNYHNHSIPEVEKLEIATKWFEERSDNHPQAWFSFTEDQQQDLLPESLNSQTVNIVIFNSSEDEMMSIQGWENPFYKDQNDGIYKIVSEFKESSSLKFFLRVHPNLAKVDNSQTKFFQNVLSKFPNLEIIAPDSPISTYALIDACDIVITFGSTVGIEAVYRKKPSILMGRSIYEDLGGMILPTSHEELVNILRKYLLTRELPTVNDPQTPFTKFGFFQKTYGYHFEYVKPYNAFKVSLQRQNEAEHFVTPSLAAKIFSKVLSKLNF